LKQNLNTTKKVFIGLGIILLVPACWYTFVIATGIFRSLFNPFLDQQISGPVVLSADWLEIKPKQPLKAERQIQQVVIEFAQHGTADVKNRGLRLADGTLVIPEVELVDDRGNHFALKAVAFGETAIGFSAEDKLPNDRTYPSVRIKANRSIALSSVNWQRWNQWDVS
jgi:hypothetical protein